MVINFREFVREPERVVRQVLDFVGAGTDGWTFKALPPGMKVRQGLGWAGPDG